MKRRQADPTADLFEVPSPAPALVGTMDYRSRVSSLVAAMLAEAAAAKIDRYEVAARASRLTGKDVSKAMLDGYTAESREEFNVPFWLAPVLETVCSSTLLTEWAATIRGGKLITGAQTIDAEIGRLEREKYQVNEHLRLLRDQRRNVR